MAVPKKSRVPVSLFAVLLICIVLPIASAKPLVIGLNESDLQSLDPQFGGTLSSEGIMVEILFNGLVRFPPGTTDLARMEPDLALDWTSNEDFTEWAFTLRPGVQFHGGYGEMTASDVRFSIERNMTATSPWRSTYENISAIRTPDDYTIEFSLSAPDPFFLLSVNNYRGGFIVSERAVNELGDQFQLNPIGTGPFAFESYRPRDSIVFVANGEYFRGSPRLDGVEMRFMPEQSSREIALRRGAIDLMVAESDQRWIESFTNSGFEVIRIGPGVPYFLYVNQSKPVLRDVRVRRAIHHAINNSEIIEFLGSDVASPIVSPIPPGYFGYTEDVRAYEYNPDAARELLAEAGYADGLELHVVNSESPGYLNMITLLQEHLRQVGIEMSLEVVDHASWHTAIRNNESDLVLYSFTRPPVSDVVLAQFFASDAIVGKPTAITNFSHYEGVDDLIHAARQTSDSGLQQELYAEAQRRIMDDAVAVPISNKYWTFLKPVDLDLGLTGPEVDSLNYAFPLNELTPPR